MIRLLLVLAMLAGAAAMDVRSRRVRNPYWWPWVAAAVALAAWWGVDWGWVAVSLVAAPVAFVAWRFDALGGADVKAVAVVALLAPEPVWVMPPAFFVLAVGIFATSTWAAIRDRQGQAPLMVGFAGAAAFLVLLQGSLVWELDMPTWNMLACAVIALGWWGLDWALYKVFRFDLTGGRDDEVPQN